MKDLVIKVIRNRKGIFGAGILLYGRNINYLM